MCSLCFWLRGDKGVIETGILVLRPYVVFSAVGRVAGAELEENSPICFSFERRDRGSTEPGVEMRQWRLFRRV